MKKVSILGVLLLAVAFVLTATVTFADGPEEPEKVSICHVNSANAIIPFYSVMLHFGKEISVSEEALETHLAHGDFDVFWGGEDAAGPIALFKDAGAKLPNADCYFGEYPDGTFYGPSAE